MENPFQLITNDLSEIKNLISKLYNQQPAAQTPEEDLTDIQGAAKILQKSKGTIYNQVSKNEIPHFKRGKKLYFSKTALIKYIHAGKILTSNEIKEEVNNTLHQQKNKYQPKGYTLEQRVKKFTSTKEIDHLTAEEAAKEASEIHFDINKDTL